MVSRSRALLVRALKAGTSWQDQSLQAQPQDRELTVEISWRALLLGAALPAQLGVRSYPVVARARPVSAHQMNLYCLDCT